MKKILLILVAALGFTATAQTGFKKSDKFVEGTFSYEKAKDVDATYTFAPTVGYFLTDKTAVLIPIFGLETVIVGVVSNPLPEENKLTALIDPFVTVAVTSALIPQEVPGELIVIVGAFVYPVPPEPTVIDSTSKYKSSI